MILLMSIVDIDGFHGEMFATMFPSLEELKGCVESGQVDEADSRAFTLMTRLKAARDFAMKKKAPHRVTR